MDLLEFWELISSYFDLEEVRTLCFGLSIEFDDLGGEGRKDKIRELILELRKQGRLLNLVEAVIEQRPNLSNVDWNKVRQDIGAIQASYRGSQRQPNDPFAEEVIPVPFQAPTVIPHFTGRADYISQIQEEIAKADENLIIGLTGLPGVGKTTLATYLAHLLQDTFTDGVLWAQLDATTAQAALIGFANAFGQGDTIAKLPDLSTQAAQVRQILAHKRLLVVLDNAQSGDDLRHLIPAGQHLLTLVTSDNNKLLANVSNLVLRLEAFSENESLDYLANVIGEERTQAEIEAAQQLHGYVSGLPLALSVAAGYLMEVPALKIAEYNSLLQEEQILENLKDWVDESRNVAAAFELSYQRLPQVGQKLFASLSLFEGPDFGGEAVAAINQMPLIRAKLELGRLESLSLIATGLGQREVVDDLKLPDSAGFGRYRLLSLLKVFAGFKLGNNADTLRQQAAHYFVQLVQQNSGQSGYSRLDVEWQNVVGVLRWANTHQEQELFIQGVLTLTHQFLGVAGFMDARGYWQEARQLLALTLEDDYKPMPLEKAQLLSNLGTYALRLGSFDSAESYLQQAQDLLEQQPSQPEIALQRSTVFELRSQLVVRKDKQAALDLLTQGLAVLKSIETEAANQQRGYIYGQMTSKLGQSGRFADALVAAEHALNLLPPEPTSARVGVLNNVGLIHYFSNKFEQATELFSKAIPQARDLAHLRYLAGLYVNMGLVEGKIGRLTKATSYQEKGLHLYQHMGDIHYASGTQINLGALYIKLGEDEQARFHLERAIATAKSYDLPEIEARARSNLAELAIHQKQWAEAEELLAKTQEICKQLQLDRLLSTVLRSQAQLALGLGKLSEATTLVEEAINKARATGDITEEGICWRAKGNILSARRQPQAAFNAWNKSVELLTGQDLFELNQTQALLAVT